MEYGHKNDQSDCIKLVGLNKFGLDETQETKKLYRPQGDHDFWRGRWKPWPFSHCCRFRQMGRTVARGRIDFPDYLSFHQPGSLR